MGRLTCQHHTNPKARASNPGFFVAGEITLGRQQFVTGIVSESEGQEVKKARPFGRRNPDAWIEERQRKLYLKQLSGQNPRALVYEHAQREGISVATAWRDYAVVKKWNESDWQEEKDKMVSRIQSMRLRCIEGAIKARQYGTAQLLLRDLGAVVQEVSPEAVAAAAPVLRVEIEKKQDS